jgi:hypothetical protein
MVEGQVHRLKLIKRQMYGRAGFDLLRLRVSSKHKLRLLEKAGSSNLRHSPKVSQNPLKVESYT